ncbi:hypothetical protein JVX91_14950 [Pseudomonas sp. PDNC002]|uniref:hypothetical protein n=1 Tax=Pseudomonas sp. PDNC002 TaxID=2811422 RepID=UPI001963FAC4|nr:hypothetical protein [Pseudomonas sp. PDNC002]QRY76918.1 hypothetical protein JVX91_14950 [Pseudomonas sp. PDNC002]
MDRQFTAQYPRERIVLDRVKEVASTTLDQKLGNMSFILEDFYSSSLTTDTYSELKASIQAKLGDDEELVNLLVGWEKEIETQEALLNVKEIDCANRENIRNKIARLNFTLLIKIATLHTEIARKAQRESKLDLAWAHTCEANYYCGKTVENSKIDLDALATEKVSNQNSDNAKQINKKYEPLKQYIADLLRIHMPHGGWPSTKAAISAITILKSEISESKNKQPSTLIGDFILKNEIPRVLDYSIEDLLHKTWIHESEDIKSALKDTVRLPRRS